jgi:tRNA(Leu) C34 or U34 (ribose-2'-O)-methylase TrmL
MISPPDIGHVSHPIPVAVEVREGAEPLHSFVHPEDAVYVFGPEDGSISPAILVRCHRVIVIPVRHCLNLATAVATVLWDRHVKASPDGPFMTPGEFEQRGASR